LVRSYSTLPFLHQEKKQGRDNAIFLPNEKNTLKAGLPGPKNIQKAKFDRLKFRKGQILKNAKAI